MESITEITKQFDNLKKEIAKVIIGQDDTILFIILAILCDGHILLEGLPGVAKTTMIRVVASALGLQFNRIQFTPDLLPSDLIGSLIFNQKTNDFETRKGPVFANLILADEINRAPAKVQAALLEAMQERQVTIGSNTFILENPFLVFATQNPIEQEGTYRLPEAQIDRFMFKLLVSYPTIQEERELLNRTLDITTINKVIDHKQIDRAQKLIKTIHVDQKIIDYIIDIIFATRSPELYKLNRIKPFIQYGVSPRATLALHQAARAYAFLQGRDFVIPDDVKFVAPATLHHRIALTYEAEAEQVSTHHIIRETLSHVPTP